MESEFLKLLNEMANEDLSNLSPNNANATANALEEIISQDSTPSSIKAPAYLKEQLLYRVEQPDIQAAAFGKKKNKKMELFLYSCKISGAVAASLLLLFTASIMQNQTTAESFEPSHPVHEKASDLSENIMQHLNNRTAGITNWFQTISDDIMNMEFNIRENN